LRRWVSYDCLVRWSFLSKKFVDRYAVVVKPVLMYEPIHCSTQFADCELKKYHTTESYYLTPSLLQKIPSHFSKHFSETTDSK